MIRIEARHCRRRAIRQKQDQSSCSTPLCWIRQASAFFKDREKAAFIRRLARTKGILVLTDSDHAGFQIRNYIKNIAAGGKVYHAYTPDLYGKERRKSRPSREESWGWKACPTR